MKQTKALRSTLEDMTAVYAGGEKTPVAFTTNTPHASDTARDCYCNVNGEHVAVCPNVRETYGKDMEGANELRVLVDTLNHEMEHVRSSPLTQKREFSARYPECSQLAGVVLNVLEDQYIDWQRLKRFRGLRGAHSFKVDAIMSNGERRPPMYNLKPSEQVAEGFLQMAFAGYVKGFSDAEREVQEAIVKCRPLVDLVRNEHDPLEREQIAHTCMSILLAAMPDPEQADEYTDENAEQMPTDEPAEVDPEDVQDMLDELEPEDLEQDAEQAADNAASIAIDPEKYDLPEWLEDELDEADGSEQQPGGQAEEQDDPWADEEREEGDDGQEQGDGEAEQETGDTPEQVEQPDDDAQAGEHGGPGEQGEDEDEQDGQGSRQRAEDDTEAGGADPIEEGIEEMERREREREAGEHWNAGDTEYEQPDEEMERRYQTIQQEVRQEQTELAAQKRRRRQRIEKVQEDAQSEYKSDRPDKVRDELRERGLAEEIVEAFKQFKTQDRWIPDTRGERLNVRNATRRLAGDFSEDQVYDRKLKAEVGDRCVGVAMDLSGSMEGVQDLKKPKMALAALHLATKTIGDDLLATGFKTYGEHPQKSEGDPILDLITGPQEDFRWEHLDGAQAGLYTPTADGVMYTLDLLKQSHRREKVLVCITDGKANIPLGGGSSRSGKKARKDAKRGVNTARQEGVKVLGMAVGSVGEQYMNDVFGPEKWLNTSSDTLTEDLVELYRSQMRTAGQRRA